MPHRLLQCTQRVARRSVLARILGVAPDSTAPALKQYLHAATLTPSPEEKLDLVIVEDLDHFMDLLAQDGVPLARDDYQTAPKLVMIPRRRFLALIAAIALFVPGSTLLTALCELLTGARPDWTPW